LGTEKDTVSCLHKDFSSANKSGKGIVKRLRTQVLVRHRGSCLLSQLLGRLRLGGSWFESSLDKKLAKTLSQQTSLNTSTREVLSRRTVITWEE
jgi:hypothetical protein